MYVSTNKSRSQKYQEYWGTKLKFANIFTLGEGGVTRTQKNRRTEIDSCNTVKNTVVTQLLYSCLQQNYLRLGQVPLQWKFCLRQIFRYYRKAERENRESLIFHSKASTSVWSDNFQLSIYGKQENTLQIPPMHNKLLAARAYPPL